MTQAQQAFPRPNPDAQPFWDACKRHELLIPQCRDCGAFHFYARTFCHKCWSPNLEWVLASGRGKLYSYVISHHPAPRREEASSIIAVVELEEGIRLMSSLRGVEADPSKLSVGMALEVAFEEVDEETTVPTFRPASS